MRCTDQVLLSLRGVSVALVAALCALQAWADTPPKCDLPVVEHAVVSSVEGGATFTLADGRHVRLAAVLAPSGAEPHAGEAAQALATLIAGKSVGMALDASATDRHGRLLAHVFRDGVWLQLELIARGHARVLTRADMRRCAKPLLAAEVVARSGKRGLWALPHYRVRAPDELDDAVGTFQIVEGRVLSLAAVKGRAYLNFGADYRTDFTATIAPRDVRRLRQDAIDPAAWAGKRVRIRGWLSRLNGPELELTHAEQIQIVE
jgi:endonuclease YncB( thermonuclease family)